MIHGQKGLLLPDGTIHQEKDVIPLKVEEMRMLSWLHEWAHYQQVNIFCKRCEKPILGQNNDTPGERSVSVSCSCREWRYSL